MTLAASPPTENRFVLWDVDWSGYLAILEVVGERPIRVTYDRGTLELMSLSRRHEQAKSLLGCLLECLMLEREMDFENGGSMTFKRQDLGRGLEPDECYWISNFSKVVGRKDYTPGTDPPPDLVLEVEVSRTVIDRLGIYAALGVPEAWRYTRGGRLEVHLLTAAGSYEVHQESPTFPNFPFVKLHHFIELGLEQGISRAVRAFREWLTQNRRGSGVPT